MECDLQGYQTLSSDALKHPLNIQPSDDDDEEISQVCQDRSTTVSTKKLLPSEVQQLLDPAVKLPEKEQMLAAAFQNEFENKTLFPEQTNDNRQQPVNVHPSVELPQLASFKTQVFCDGRKNVGATLHPEVVVPFRRGQSPEDGTEPQPFVKDGLTQTESCAKQSVEPTIRQKKSLKENLPAVVKLNKLPISISTVESVLVPRPPTGARIDFWSLSKLGPTKDTSSTPAPKTPLKISERDLRERSEDETQSTTFRLKSKSSRDTGECLPLTSKDQFPALIAASTVAKVPEEVCSSHIFWLFCLLALVS